MVVRECTHSQVRPVTGVVVLGQGNEFFGHFTHFDRKTLDYQFKLPHVFGDSVTMAQHCR